MVKNNLGKKNNKQASANKLKIPPENPITKYALFNRHSKSYFL